MHGTAKTGVDIASMGVMRPDLAMRNIIPVVMAGVLGIYGLIVAVIVQGLIDPPNGNAPKYGSYTGFAHLAAGLCCSLSGLAAGIAIGVVGYAGVRAVGQQEKLFVTMILIAKVPSAAGAVRPDRGADPVSEEERLPVGVAGSRRWYSSCRLHSRCFG
ncbi:hypothetical protein PF008_g3105 [Phytophthora fragariae]|uniref:V-type proton ATPase proteolipid subunit n=1 Tax=Phytophthora fragariae TaxID=53985 RepID=A0A6G0SH77_9STRA|nr:hypothetical protein PF008_g3105 [Phytophthora fragariae]